MKNVHWKQYNLYTVHTYLGHFFQSKLFSLIYIFQLNGFKLFHGVDQLKLEKYIETQKLFIQQAETQKLF